MSEFLLPAEEYGRDLNVLKHYVEDMAFYLSRQTGKPEDWCQSYVKKLIGKDGKYPINNPEVTMIAKDANGDRFVGKTGYLNYLRNIQEKDLIAAPSMTAYIQPKERKGLVGMYIEQNLALRKEAKHEMFIADMAAQSAATPELKEQFEQTANIKNNEQTSHKIFNNGVSGAQSIGSTPLALMSAHSTLTSGCRTATSYANATIERFQVGLRHYWSGECVRSNIVAVIRQAAHHRITEVMAKYDLRAPTVQETMDMINRSTSQYWTNKEEEASILSFVEKLSDHERAAYCYSGDMYTLRLCNEAFVRKFFEEMSSPGEYDIPDPLEASKKLKGDEQILAMFLTAEHTFGKTLQDMQDNNETENLYRVVCAYMHTKSHMAKYSDLIKAFFVTKSLPGNISYTRDIRRGAVVGSDTDSSLFNSRRWVSWYHGGTVKFDWESQKVWHSMVYLTCQVVAHSLALLSGGMGVKTADLFKLAMKNEYAFPVFALTPIAKHYFASMSAREGNIYKKFKKETKGVGFVDSNSPREIIAECGGYIDMILNEIYETGSLRALPILTSMANTERSVIESVKRGEAAYLKRVYVKPKDGYKKPMSSVYKYHDMWDRAFAHLYGAAPTLPYRGVRVAADLGNKTSVQEWLMTIKDDKCRTELEKIFIGDGKKAIKIESFVLPLDIIEKQGIPEEILEAVNLRKLAYGICSPFYLVMESMGIRMINKKYTRLLSDMV